MSKLNLAELGHWLKVTQLVGGRAVFSLWEPAFPHASAAQMWKTPWISEGQETPPFTRRTSGVNRKLQWWQVSGSSQVSAFTRILLLFVHFLALDWDVSQDKIWVRCILLVSNISHFFMMYGCFLLGWSNSCRIIKLRLHFSLISTASFGSPAPALLSWDKLPPFDSLHCSTRVPLTLSLPLSLSLLSVTCFLPQRLFG